MIKFKFGEAEFSCDSPKAAAELYLLLTDARKSSIERMTDQIMGRPTASLFDTQGHIGIAANVTQAAVIPPKTPAQVVEELNKRIGSSIDATEMAEILGVAKVTAVGPRLAGVKAKLLEAKPPIDLDVYLDKSQSGNGPVYWFIRVSIEPH